MIAPKLGDYMSKDPRQKEIRRRRHRRMKRLKERHRLAQKMAQRKRREAEGT